MRESVDAIRICTGKEQWNSSIGLTFECPELTFMPVAKVNLVGQQITPIRSSVFAYQVSSRCTASHPIRKRTPSFDGALIELVRCELEHGSNINSAVGRRCL
ncbi:MAG: hypothetical protein ACOVQ6_02865 [Brevundimonas sp.]